MPRAAPSSAQSRATSKTTAKGRSTSKTAAKGRTKRKTATKGRTKSKPAPTGRTKCKTTTKSRAARKTVTKVRSTSKTAPKGRAARKAAPKSRAKSKTAPKGRKTAQRADPALWERVRRRWLAASAGGVAGKWNARKAMLAVQEYKRLGGRYVGRRSPENSLKKWEREDWGYITAPRGTPRGPPRGRYLPAAVRAALTPAEARRENRLKGARRGEWVPYSESVRRKFSRITRAAPPKKGRGESRLMSEREYAEYRALVSEIDKDFEFASRIPPDDGPLSVHGFVANRAFVPFITVVMQLDRIDPQAPLAIRARAMSDRLKELSEIHVARPKKTPAARGPHSRS